MSRETDRSSSGPQGQGRGGPYPPGTEPYGSGAAGGSGDADNAATLGSNAGAKERSQDRKTETTLTTRIRINIPGSRPIPPVVMRTPVDEDESDDAASDSGAPQSAPADGLRPPGSQGPAAGAGSGPASGAPDASGPSEDTSGGSGFTQQTSDWFAPRRKPGAGSGSTGGAGSAVGGAAGQGGGSGAAPGTGESGYGSNTPYGVGNPYGVGEQQSSGDPYDTGSHPLHPIDTTPADGTPRSAIHGLLEPPASGPGSTDSASAGGPTTGPATGEMPLPRRPRPGTGAPGAEPPADSTLGLGAGVAPFAPGGAGEEAYGRAGVRDGHAVPDGSGDDQIVSDTFVSRPRATGPGAGVPSPFQGPGQESAAPSFGEVRTFDGDDNEEDGSGRSKLMLVGVGLAAVLAIAYGAGLLFDHADVPNGTTVLGVDIGGTSRHEAVNKLDAAFGDRTTQPFTVVASGRKAQLKPSVAGLTLDTEATVRNAAGRDYNPVTVIGSLFGVERDAEPALEVDGEKMASALADVSRSTGDGGAPKDGMVKFVRGKAVAVQGEPHKGIDPRRASAELEDAYRTRAATGDNSPVRLPVTLQQPKIGKAELNRAVKEFGKPAMSGLVTIKAGNASIQFSPEKSLPKFLSMKPVNGTLVDTYDLPVLKQLYGTTFDGVRIARGDGSKTPVTPQDVAGALRLALKETTPAKRVQEIKLNAQ